MKKILFAIVSICLLLPIFNSCKTSEQALKVISYNIRVGSAPDGDHHWDKRKIATPAMIEDQKPDIFGLQEALKMQLDYIEETCPDYDHVGVHRDDGIQFLAFGDPRSTLKGLGCRLLPHCDLGPAEGQTLRQILLLRQHPPRPYRPGGSCKGAQPDSRPHRRHQS